MTTFERLYGSFMAGGASILVGHATDSASMGLAAFGCMMFIQYLAVIILGAIRARKT